MTNKTTHLKDPNPEKPQIRQHFGDQVIVELPGGKGKVVQLRRDQVEIELPREWGYVETRKTKHSNKGDSYE
jgi:hypothetical protein